MSKHKLMIIVGLLFSGILLAFVIDQINWREFRDALASLNYFLLPLPMLAISLATTLRSVRWRLVTRRDEDELAPYWHSYNLGYLANLIYPLKAGEVLRMVALSKYKNHPLTLTTASATIDRIMDLFGMGTMLLIVVSAHSLKSIGIDASALSFIMVPLAVLVLLGLVVTYGERLSPFVQRICAKSSSRFANIVWRLFRDVLDILAQFRNVRRTTLIVMLQAVIVVVDYAALWFIFMAFGWELPFMAAITAGVFIQIGMTIPAAPAGLGAHQLACILALSLYGIDESSAVAFSIVQQGISLSYFAVVGTLASYLLGVGLGDTAKAENAKV